MEVVIQLMLCLVFFILVLREYRQQRQGYLLVTLIVLGLLGLTKVWVPLVENEIIRYVIVMVTLSACIFSYYLIQKQDKQ